MINNSTPAELARYLWLINRGNDHYGRKYLGMGAEGFMHLADEFVTHAIQICYDTPIGEDVVANLRAEGIENEQLINIILNEFQRQKQENPNFLQQRGSRYRNTRNSVRDGASERDSESPDRGTAGRSDDKNGRVDRGSRQNSRSRREYTEERIAKLRAAAIQRLLNYTYKGIIVSEETYSHYDEATKCRMPLYRANNEFRKGDFINVHESEDGKHVLLHTSHFVDNYQPRSPVWMKELADIVRPYIID